jgi:hypothetical protein
MDSGDAWACGPPPLRSPRPRCLCALPQVVSPRRALCHWTRYAALLSHSAAAELKHTHGWDTLTALSAVPQEQLQGMPVS